jgi:hypothetical protein
MFRPFRQLLTACPVLFAVCAAHAGTIETPGCNELTAKDCIALSLNAMGGKEMLESIRNIQLDIAAHTALTEQSPRQEPFLTSYERSKATIDFAGQRMRVNGHLIWPESDPGQAEMDTTVIVTPNGGVNHSPRGDSPCSLSDIDDLNEELALGPTRLLLTALSARDLHYEAPETLRSTSHAVVGFTWNKVPVRILLNSYNHLPDAVETTQQFRDFWYYWGDVKQRVYWDNWAYTHGIEYPTNLITERNGTIWNSTQVLDIQFNVQLDEKNFAMDEKAAQQSMQQKGWDRSFRTDKSAHLADGIDLYAGSWNTTIVQQSDGLVILETPISGTFMQGAFDEAKKKYPQSRIKAVISTSDSWPHVGGIRFDVAGGKPVYILDLNQPLLDRIVAAPHTIAPDALQSSPKHPDWQIVSGKTEVGSGPNRMELYPLRGATTERQYMVYFPQHHLLYASDTLVITPDKTLYDPQMMHEVRQAVEREHLTVDTVYAMHQGPTSWSEVVSLLDKI